MNWRARYRRWHEHHSLLAYSLVAAVLLSTIPIGLAMWWLGRISNGFLSLGRWPDAQHTGKPAITLVTGTYVFSGTVFWGRGVQTWSQASPLGVKYPFSGLSTFGPQDFDAWVADLECPVTYAEVPVSYQEDKLVFNCRPEYLAEAATYFTHFNVANNHTDNAGPAGLDATRQALLATGIQPFGHYDSAATQDICEIVSVQVRYATSDNQTGAGRMPMAFCALHYFYRLPLPGEIEQIKAYSDYVPTIAFVHMGVEYKPEADAIQREVLHKVANQQPLAVVANNPHWVQDSEAYNGIPIVYSTGNFIFDQMYNSEVTRSASLKMTIKPAYTAALQAWLDIGDTCKAYKDTCLEYIKQNDLQKPDLRPQFDIIVGDGAGQLTKLADPNVRAATLERLRWPQTHANLK